jgi:hypothetical protein
MPQIAQRLREPAAFALLAFAVLATLFRTIDFLFAPGQTCFGSVCSGPNFSTRAIGAVDGLANPLMALVLVAAVFLAHFGTHLKQAKVVSLVALVTAGVALLFGAVALFASFGADGYTGWSKTESFFVGVAELAVYGIAAWLLLGYYQQHAPAQPKSVIGGPPPQVQFQQPGQWQQPGQTQQQAPAQGQWNPPVPQQQPPQQWGQQPQQPQGQQPQGQPWGTPPPPPAPPQQQGFAGGSDSMMTQAIPAVPQPQQPQQPAPPQQAAPETQQFPPVGNWTSE